MRPSLRTPAAKKDYFWHAVALCTLTALCIYLPYVIFDATGGSFFHYAGDFNSQQITFYTYANQFVKQGGGYSWLTDLGSGFVNSYSFYLLGSPFFWLSCLLPARLVPYAMVPLLCLKYGVAGGGAYLWLKRYTRRSGSALIGACLYALSGFTVYNAFFNHFVDVVALFPYLLWALDAAMYDRRRGPFAALVALNLLNNYFFFFGQALFLAIYFVCKCLSGEYRLNRRCFAVLAAETLLGCAMGCVLVWPAFISLMQNPRTVDVANGYDLLFYGSVQQYFAIFLSFFQIPDAPYMSNLWNEGIIKWTSMTAYLPLCSCVGAIAWLRQKPRTAFKRILCVCIACAFVPVLNSAFYMLNSSYYARWWYMPVLLMAAVTVLGLEDRRVDPTQGAGVAVAVMMASMALALVPTLDEETEKWQLGVVEDQSKFWLFFAVTLLGLLLYLQLIKKCREGRRFRAGLLAAVLGFSVLYGNLHVACTKLNQQEGDADFALRCYHQGPQLGQTLTDMADGEFFRFDAYDCDDNLGVWAGVPCLRFFNSTVEPSILKFYPSVGVERDVGSRPEYELYALRGLLSVRYMVVPYDSVSEFEQELNGASAQVTVVEGEGPRNDPEGWHYRRRSGDYCIYENENWLPMGFCYEYYVTQEELERRSDTAAGVLLTQALVLSDEQIERYGALLSPLPEEQQTRATYEDYQQYCADRRTMACSDLTADNRGFTAHISLAQEQLVFFSVPYTEGFTATVNGQPAPVEEVSNGLTAVLCPAGENEIRVDYQTPGLAQSSTAAAAGAVLFVVYLLIWHIYRRRQRAALPAQKESMTQEPPQETPQEE